MISDGHSEQATADLGAGLTMAELRKLRRRNRVLSIAQACATLALAPFAAALFGSFTDSDLGVFDDSPGVVGCRALGVSLSLAPLSAYSASALSRPLDCSAEGCSS